MNVLTYGHAPRGSRRTTLRVGLLTLLVLASALLISATPRINRLYRFRHAASVRISPATVVYEEHNGPSTLPFMAEGPLDASGTRRYVAVPEPLRAWTATATAPLFRGWLRVPGGGEELVVFFLPVRPPIPSKMVFSNTFTSAKCRHVGHWRSSAIRGTIPGLFRETGFFYSYEFSGDDPRQWSFYFENKAIVYRFYGGQRDPQDPSHFTVDFDADDRRVRLHGRMQSDKALHLSLEALSPDPVYPD